MNKLKKILMVFAFATLLSLMPSITAKAYIDASPSSGTTGVAPISIYVDVGGAANKVKYTASSTFPALADMWNMPGNGYQSFECLGQWYLHVYNSWTGERATFGPYIREIAPPNAPTITGPSTWVKGSASFTLTSNGDNGSGSTDPYNGIYSYYCAGVRGAEIGTGTWQGYGGTYTVSTEGWKTVQGRVIDWVDNVSAVTSRSFGVDNSIPLNDGLTATLTDADHVYIKATNVRDTLSGLKPSTVRVAVWHNGETYRDWYTLTNIAGTNDYQTTVTLDTGNHANKYCTFNVHLFAGDNVANDGNLDTVTFYRTRPTIRTEDTWMENPYGLHQYYNSTTGVHWIRPGEKFRVVTGVTTDTGYRPEGVNWQWTNTAVNSQYGLYEESLFDVLYMVTGGTTFANNTVVGGSGRWYGNEALFGTGNPWEYYSWDDFTINLNNLDTKVRSKGVRYTDGVYSGAYGGTLSIYTDGDEPTITGSSIQNVTPYGYDVVVTGVTDTRSGVNRVTFNTWTTSGGQDDLISEVGTNMGGGTWKYHVDIADHGNEYGQYNTSIYTCDNLVNTGLVSNVITNVNKPTAVAGTVAISNHEFSDARGYWVKKGDPFNVTVSATVQNPYSGFNINSLHALTNVTGYTTPGSNLNSYLDNVAASSTVGSRSAINYLNMPYISSTMTRGTNGAATTVFNTRVDEDAKVLDIYPLARIYTGGAYADSTKLFSESSPYYDATKDVIVNSDGRAPTAGPSSALGNSLKYTITDNGGSGIKQIVVTVNGTVQTTMNINAATIDAYANLSTGANTVSLTMTDNVGNVSTVSGSYNIPVEATGAITLSTVTDLGRIKLKAAATSTGTYDAYTKVTTKFNKLELLPAATLATSTNGVLNYSTLFDDTVNTAPATTFTVLNDASGYTSAVKWNAMIDPTQHYRFQLPAAISDTYWVFNDTTNVWSSAVGADATVMLDDEVTDFASGFDHYEYTIKRLTNESGVAYSPEVTAVANTVTTGTQVDVSRLQPGNYRIDMYMFDNNNNRSVISSKTFTVNTAPTNLRPNLKVTAVKDPRWINAPYPFIYDTQATDTNYHNYNPNFPLGKAYLYSGATIKCGYGINFEISRYSLTGITDIHILYHFKDDVGNELKILKDGVDISSADGTLDSNGNKMYFKNFHASVPTTGTSMIIKHFIPVPETIEVRNATTNALYSGRINVVAELTISNTTGTSSPYLVPLYSVNQSESALDDLSVDKQR